MPDKPVKVDQVVLGADDPSAPTFPFRIHEYIGCEILTGGNLSSTFPGGACAPDDVPDFCGTAPDLHSISVGSPILTMNLLGYYLVATVERVDYVTGTAWASTLVGNLGVSLMYAEDDRGVWVSTGLINLNAIQRVALSLDELQNPN